MNQTKWIKEIIGGAVEEHGFEYEGCSRNGYIQDYDYMRKKEDIRQNILIGVKPDQMEMEFMTSAYGQENVYASGLIESNFEIDDENRWITWRDEEEFKQVLYHFREIILKKGFDILEEISKPTTEVRPRKETYWKLYQEHKALDEEYRKAYGLENIESTVTLMERIVAIIVDNQDKAFEEVEPLLIGLAAVYGEELIKKCGGKWSWNRGYNTCVVKGIPSWDGKKVVNPLASTINHWKYKRNEPDVFIREFKESPFDIVT